MTLHEEAMQLCEKIYAIAPQSYKDALPYSPLEVALLCAEAYFKSGCEPANTKVVEEKTCVYHAIQQTKEQTYKPFDVDKCCELYAEGRSVWFISKYIKRPEKYIINALRDRGFPVYDSYFSSIPWLNKVRPKGMDIPKDVPFVTKTPDTREIMTLQDNCVGPTLEILSLLANRPMDMVKFITKRDILLRSDFLSGITLEDFLYKTRYNVIEMYKAGRSVIYLVNYYHGNKSPIENMLEQSDVPYSNSLYSYNINTYVHADDATNIFGVDKENDHHHVAPIQEALERTNYRVGVDPYDTEPDETEIQIIKRCLSNSYYFVPIERLLHTALCRTKRNIASIASAIETERSYDIT